MKTIRDSRRKGQTRRKLLFQAVLGLGAGSILYASVDVTAWKAYETVEESWIRERHELLVQEAPTALNVAALDLEVRLTDLRKRALEFRYIIGHDANLLQGGVWQMASLPISPQTQKELQAITDYRRITDKLKRLTETLRHHPQYEILQRAQMRLWKTPQYRDVHRRYTGRMQELQRVYCDAAPTTAPSLADAQ